MDEKLLTQAKPDVNMVNGLNNLRVKWLTYLVYFLLTILTIITAWSVLRVDSLQAEFQDMPDKFVRTERYLNDQNRIERTLSRIEAKLDRINERSQK